MIARLVLVAAVAGCATDVTGASEDIPGIDLDAEPSSSAGDYKADSATAQVVYLNYGGDTIEGGYYCSDAPSNCSRLVAGTQYMAPFTLSTQWDRGQVVGAITRCVGMFFRDMDIRFVTDRPASGPYTMMMIGAIYPTQLGFETNAGPYGRAPVDCDNSNKNDIGFLLLQDSIEPDFYYMCRSIAHELGHTFGMVHTRGENTIYGDRVDMMCESDQCQEAAANGTAKWDVINRAQPTDATACDGTKRQNTYARLMDTLGVAR